MDPKLQKIVTAVARAQSGDVVDLPRIEADVKIALLLNAIDDVWECFAAGIVTAEAGEEMLQLLESKLNEEIFQQIGLHDPPEDRARRAAHLAAHRAARGVRKVRGAK